MKSIEKSVDFIFFGGIKMNIHAYFTVIWYIIMLPIVFKMLLSMRLEQLFKRGSQTEIRLLYIIKKFELTH